MEDTNIGDRIALLRKSRGLTQKQLAEMLHVSDKAVSRWERSESAPDLSLIPMIADLFGISCDDLLRGESRPAPEPPREQVPPSVMTPTSLRIYFVTACWLVILGLTVCLVCYLGLGYRYAVLGFCLELALFIGAAICITIGILKAPEETTVKKDSAAKLAILELCLLSGTALTLNRSLDHEEVLLLGIPLICVVLMGGLLIKWFLIVPTDDEKLHSLRSSVARGVTIAWIITLTVCPGLSLGFGIAGLLILFLVFITLEVLAALVIYRHEKKELINKQ